MVDEKEDLASKFPDLSPTRISTITRVVKEFEECQNASEVARKLSLNRQSVRHMMESDLAKYILTQATAKLLANVGKATDALIDLLDEPDPAIRYKAAVTITKRFGVTEDKTPMQVELPKPVIIQRMDGTEIILGDMPVDEDTKQEQ